VSFLSIFSIPFLRFRWVWRFFKLVDRQAAPSHGSNIDFPLASLLSCVLIHIWAVAWDGFLVVNRFPQLILVFCFLSCFWTLQASLGLMHFQYIACFKSLNGSRHYYWVSIQICSAFLERLLPYEERSGFLVLLLFLLSCVYRDYSSGRSPSSRAKRWWCSLFFLVDGLPVTRGELTANLVLFVCSFVPSFSWSGNVGMYFKCVVCEVESPP
jgi:hypothetical protein